MEIAEWNWHLFDGKPVELNGINSKYVFDDPGIFVVTLIGSDEEGSWDTDTMTVTVLDITPPVSVNRNPIK